MSCCFLSHMSPASLSLRDVWNSHKAKVLQHQGYVRKSLSWFCICSSAFSCLNGLRHNILHMQPFTERNQLGKSVLKHHTLLSFLGEGELIQPVKKSRNLFVKCTNRMALDHLTIPELFYSRRKESQMPELFCSRLRKARGTATDK